MLFVNFISQNIGTIVVLAIVAAIVALLIFKLVKDKKASKSSCSCGCSSCPMRDGCRGNSESEIQNSK